MVSAKMYHKTKYCNKKSTFGPNKLLFFKQPEKQCFEYYKVWLAFPCYGGGAIHASLCQDNSTLYTEDRFSLRLLSPSLHHKITNTNFWFCGPKFSTQFCTSRNECLQHGMYHLIRNKMYQDIASVSSWRQVFQQKLQLESSFLYPTLVGPR